MRLEMVFFRSKWRYWPSAAIVLLLGAAAIAGDREILDVLRGEPDESVAPSLGYYEGLLRTPGAGASAADQPPPGWIAFGDPKAGLVVELPSYLRWRLRPNLSTTWNGSTFRTNSLGYRSPEIAERKPPGTYRILVFGSSNTMGYGIDDDAMYTVLLERWLNERAGRPGAFEVVNLSVSGDSPSRRLYRMQQEAQRLEPDWILTDVTFFDPWLEDRQIQAAIDRHLPIPYPFVEDAIRRRGMGGGLTFQAFTDAFRGESERLFEPIYAGWAAESRRLGVPMTLVVLPRSDSKDRSERLRSVILGLAGRNGLDCLDLSEAFDDLRVEEFRISEWERHTSTRGHRAIFEAIRDALIARGGPPGAGPGR